MKAEEFSAEINEEINRRSRGPRFQYLCEQHTVGSVMANGCQVTIGRVADWSAARRAGK